MNRFSFRPQVEPLNERCLPSANPVIAISDMGHMAPVVNIRASHGHAVPFKSAFECSVDLSSGTVSSTGSSVSFGKDGSEHWTWTSLGHADNVDIGAKRGVYSGTGTLVTSTGDQLFYTFTTSWRLSTGEGTHSINFTGGTGRFAGASGRYFGHCTITADPASSTTFRCQSEGIGVLIVPHPRHEATGRGR